MTPRSGPTEARWRYAARSVIGTSHLRSDTPCQDFCAVHDVDLGRGAEAIIGVVADGAGSAARSEAGAQDACRSFLEFARLGVEHLRSEIQYLDDAFGPAALHDVRINLAQMAREAGEPLSSYACTLIGAIVADEAAYFLQIGDGAVVFRNQTEDGLTPWRLALKPQRGEFVNETIFVTRTDAERRLSLCRIQGRVAEFALMTDGVEQLAIKLATGEPHAPFLEHAMRGLRRARAPGRCADQEAWIETFLASEQVSSRTDDDKSLLLCSRHPE